MQNCNEIIPYLFLGNRSSIDVPNMQFSLLVNCTEDVKFPAYQAEFIRLSVKDDPYQSTTMYNLIVAQNVLDKIHSYVVNKKPVLVYCGQGSQRSCAVVACYLIKYYGSSPEYAIQFIKSKHPMAFFGNINFIQTIGMVSASSYNN
ncbi:phosphatases II [Tupanvirus deep ocean]|uniref:Phosphatases II n=1 Tax=Tupanvirus soda lake TaxID=2126985 RepID=A0A2K9L1W9_9VIRU|nr:phosphatases II [Tupanvirus deep ocean]AUL79716.2 phosphatases II [Tupanvirus deep ocean]